MFALLIGAIKWKQGDYQCAVKWYQKHLSSDYKESSEGKLVFYFLTLFTLWSCTLMMRRSEACVSDFTKYSCLMLYLCCSLPILTHTPYANADLWGQCLQMEPSLSLLFALQWSTNWEFLLKSNSSIISPYRGNYIFNKPKCLKLN